MNKFNEGVRIKNDEECKQYIKEHVELCKQIDERDIKETNIRKAVIKYIETKYPETEAIFGYDEGRTYIKLKKNCNTTHFLDLTELIELSGIFGENCSIYFHDDEDYESIEAKFMIEEWEVKK